MVESSAAQRGAQVWIGSQFSAYTPSHMQMLLALSSPLLCTFRHGRLSSYCTTNSTLWSQIIDTRTVLIDTRTVLTAPALQIPSIIGLIVKVIVHKGCAFHFTEQLIRITSHGRTLFSISNYKDHFRNIYISIYSE